MNLNPFSTKEPEPTAQETQETQETPTPPTAEEIAAKTLELQKQQDEQQQKEVSPSQEEMVKQWQETRTNVISKFAESNSAFLNSKLSKSEETHSPELLEAVSQLQAQSTFDGLQEAIRYVENRYQKIIEDLESRIDERAEKKVQSVQAEHALYREFPNLREHEDAVVSLANAIIPKLGKLPGDELLKQFGIRASAALGVPVPDKYQTGNWNGSDRTGVSHLGGLPAPTSKKSPLDLLNEAQGIEVR